MTLIQTKSSTAKLLQNRVALITGASKGIGAAVGINYHISFFHELRLSKLNQ